MDVDMPHGRWHAAWTLTCSREMGMQHRHGDTAWTRISIIDMDM
jgi:hypothetical protein